MDNIYADSFERLLLEHCTPQAVRAVEHGKGADELWNVIEASGFGNVLLPEEADGAGLSLDEAFTLFELCGAFALPLPLAETIVARALLTAAQQPVPVGSIAWGAGTISGNVLRGDAVAYGAVAHYVLLHFADGTASLLPADAALREPGLFPLDAHLEWPTDALEKAGRIELPDVDFLAVHACLSAVQLAGILQATFERTLEYANERSQFGRPIGKFQALQHQLSVMAEHVSSARMAAQLGCRGRPGQIMRPAAAIAKILTSEAAREVAAIAHSIHGAIGLTEEFDLQLYTRRLYWLRQAAGAEGFWEGELGALALSRSERAIDLVREYSDVHKDDR
ncbi:acyl-CoA dehydrogenase [Pandoraea terrae]|nr:acyl-CoA dehydrogenase [Pandoraea terrae]